MHRELLSSPGPLLGGTGNLKRESSYREGTAWARLRFIYSRGVMTNPRPFVERNPIL